MTALRRNEDAASAARTKKPLTWADSWLPTLLVCVGAGVVAIFAAPLILGALIGLAVNDAQSLRIVPFMVLGSVMGIALFLALAWKARDVQVATSFFVPPAIPLLCILILFFHVNRPDHFLPLNESEVKAKLHDPQFLRYLKTPLSSAEKNAIRSSISDGSLTGEEMDTLLNHFGAEFSRDIASSSHAAAENFLWIFLHGDLESRKALTMNPAVPDDVLRKLLTDPNPEVLRLSQRAAGQRLCDPEVLRSIYIKKSDRTVPSNRPKYLASDPQLPDLMAANPCTPPDVLTWMGQSGISQIVNPARAALAQRALAGK